MCKVFIFVSFLLFFQSAITHTSRSDKTQATFYWTPGQDLGHINFRFVLICFLKNSFRFPYHAYFWHMRYIYFFQFPVPLLSRISIPSGLTSHLLSYETLWTPSLAPAVRPMETKIMQERISRRIPCSQYSAFCQHCSLFCRNFYGYTKASYMWLHVYSLKKDK